MGYIIATGACFICNKIFSFHPNKVPSLNGEPICKTCIDTINPIRTAKGYQPIAYDTDAYQCADANDIDWG